MCMNIWIQVATPVTYSNTQFKSLIITTKSNCKYYILNTNYEIQKEFALTYIFWILSRKVKL